MQRRFVTVDVFTDRAFGGNPLAVVLEAEGLCAAQMQSIATEFNLSETTFVLPPENPSHTAKLRIFTPRIEVPFAGHPNVGTAVAVARERTARSEPALDQFIFEEAAGLVEIRLLRERGMAVGAEIKAPKPLSIGPSATPEDAAACLSLAVEEIVASHHAPQVVSVGLPFLVVEVLSREALRRCKPDTQAHERVLPPRGVDGVYAYVRGAGASELHARMFSPLDATIEDPATGSATGAAIALLASLQAERDATISWRVEQGVDMGRPSLITGRTEKRDGVVTAVHIAGSVVSVMQGSLQMGE
jgi:trans-2,3-dihydro-3-hydroxyanthranilate isomerase